MRVGVIGCGSWGSRHVRVFSSNPLVSRVVIIDERPDVRHSVGESFPEALRRSTFDEAVDDLDAVVVATPAESHFDVAAAAIDAGKHVLVEKPMATNTSDALELVVMAERAGVTLAVGHTFVYNAAVSKLAEIAQGGELGRLHYIDAARLNLGLYRDKVNVLWDLATHDISITMALLEDTPDTVSAWGTRHTAYFTEDVAALRMTFEDLGVESTVRVSWLDPLKVRRTTVAGSEKMAIYDDTEVNERVKVFDRGRQLDGTEPSHRPEVTYHSRKTTTPHIDFIEPLQVAATDFLKCCETGMSPTADGRAGLAVVSVLEASDFSLLENGAPIPVTVPRLVVPTTERRSA